MAIKYAEEIVRDIEGRGSIVVPENCVTGETFEEWLKQQHIKEKRNMTAGDSTASSHVKQNDSEMTLIRFLHIGNNCLNNHRKKFR